MVHGARALNQALGVLRGKEWSLSEVGCAIVGVWGGEREGRGEGGEGSV